MLTKSIIERKFHYEGNLNKTMGQYIESFRN